MAKMTDRIDELKLERDSLIQRYLERHGWRHSSDFPDSCWRWEKRIAADRTVTETEAGALRMQRDFLDYTEAAKDSP